MTTEPFPLTPRRGPSRAEVYHATRDLPLVCMHGHVDAGVLAQDRSFPDPAGLFVVPDHYLLRMLVSQGAELRDLGVAAGDGPVETDPRVDLAALLRRDGTSSGVRRRGTGWSTGCTRSSR